MLSTKKKILLFTDWYEPGCRAGGPIRSSVNFVQHMHEDYSIYIFTADRDLNATEPYQDIESDQWQKKTGDIHIYYCSPRQLTWKNIRRQLGLVQPDFIYLNSMFSKYFTVYPLLANKQHNPPSQLVLAPRGMLRASALEFKSFKKKLFLFLFRLMQFHKHIFFQAADETEKEDIRHWFGSRARIDHVPNFPGKSADYASQIKKKPGELFILFVGRIHPIKNLDYLLQVLHSSSANIRLTIVGSIEDSAFWQKCELMIGQLPPCISVSYLGELPNKRIPEVLKEQHIFSLPTRGENFGHAIFEALSAGKPVLISDQTPWRNLEKAGAGWDIPLAHHEKFKEAIAEASAWDQDEYDTRSRHAFDFARNNIDIAQLQKKYRQLFA